MIRVSIVVPGMIMQLAYVTVCWFQVSNYSNSYSFFNFY